MNVFETIGRVKTFLSHGIWRVRLEEERGARRFMLRSLRILLIAVKEFFRNNCSLWASSLTFFSLLSIVPVFALAFAVAKGFGLQAHLERLLHEQIVGREEITSRVLEYSRNLLENTQGEVLAGVGAAFLIWSVFRILETAELSFNTIWGDVPSRTLGRKFSDYLSLMLIGPVLIIISSSAMVLLATEISALLERLGFLGVISTAVTMVIRIVPYVMIWILLSLMYIFLPNTKVRFLSGFIGGITAGTTFVVVQFVYIFFQIGVARYNAIYGSFAALPLFLFWLNISWIIVLFGFELTYAHQNESKYEFEPEVRKISHSFRMLLSLQVMHHIVKRFMNGAKPPALSGISAGLAVPPMIADEILGSLSKSGLIVAIPCDGEEGSAYQPSRDIDIFTVSYVIKALQNTGIDTIPVAETESLKRIRKSLERFEALIEGSDADVRLKDI